MKALTHPLFLVFWFGFFSSPFPLACLYARVVKTGIHFLAVRLQTQHGAGKDGTRACAICILFAWNVLVSKYKLNFFFFFKAVCVLAITDCHCKRKGGVPVGWVLFYFLTFFFCIVGSISFNSFSLALVPSTVKLPWYSSRWCPMHRVAGGMPLPLPLLWAYYFL